LYWDKIGNTTPKEEVNKPNQSNSQEKNFVKMQAVDYDTDDSTILPEARPLDSSKDSLKNEVVNGPRELAGQDTPDSNEWFEGRIEAWKGGYGFVACEDEEGKTHKYFLHESNVETSDNKVFLRKGMGVQFQIVRKDNETKDAAVNVRALDGGPLTFHAKQGATDKYDREILFDGQYFEGEIAFYRRQRGFGRIRAVEGTLADAGAPEEEIGLVYFKESDLCCEGYPTKIDQGDLVRFQLFESTLGYGATMIQLQNGDCFPIFTEEMREEKRALNNTRQDERRAERTAKIDAEFAEIDTAERFTGQVDAFIAFRHGLIIPDDEQAADMKNFGIVRQGKICFQCTEIQTEQRPVMIDLQTRVSFSLMRKGRVLYAIDVRTEEGGNIHAETEAPMPDAREIESDDIYEGKVVFYNWKRGHGRIELPSEEEQYYFHRSDLQSTDKLPGVNAGTEVMCQKCVDDKGVSVTNVFTIEGEKFEGVEQENAVSSERRSRPRFRGGRRGGRGRGRGRRGGRGRGRGGRGRRRGRGGNSRRI